MVRVIAGMDRERGAATMVGSRFGFGGRRGPPVTQDYPEAPQAAADTIPSTPRRRMKSEDRHHGNTPQEDRPRDPAALAERPPYWAGCQEKDFEGLVEFILDAVRGAGRGSGAERPRSEKELLDLWEMLRGKYAAGLASGKPAASPPAQPQSKGDRLSAKYARYWRLVDREEELRDTPVKKNKKKWQELRETEKKIEKVEREIVQLGGSVYDHSYPPDAGEGKGAPAPVPWKLTDPRYRSLMEVLGVIKGAFDPTSRPLGRVAWEILPQGESADGIRRLFEGLRRRGGLTGFDPERLDNALALPFKKGYTGKSGFDGYVVFTYEHTHKVLLECPRVGNAAYVIGLPTERWSRMNKQELRANRSGEVCKIDHRGGWERKVREALDLP